MADSMRKAVLEAAIQTVCEDRPDAYGEPENNFALIADLWSTYLDRTVMADDVAMMMCLLKIARIKTGRSKLDSYIDLAGYAACAADTGGPESV
jgi:hypothetical protein|nr:MAG TPA: hypothetical protein [Caudoviricetes sp.]